MFLIGVAGVYLDQSRQFMLSTLLSLGLVFFFSSKIRYKGLMVVFLGLAAMVLFMNAYKLFGDLMDMTRGDLTRDNIRLLSYTTFGLELWGGPLSVLFGNGPVGHSAYGDNVLYLYETLGMYHADVGMVGAANLYGVVTVLFFVVFYIMYVAKHWKKIQMHLKMYFLALLINAPLVTIFTQSINWFVFFAFMLVLADRDIVRYERKLAS